MALRLQVKTALFEEMPQQWRVNSNTLSDLNGPIFEPQTSCSIDERITAQPTGVVVNNFHIN